MNRITQALGLTATMAAMMTLGACAHKQAAKSTPPPPPPAPAPTITISASPDTIAQGQSTQLQWQAQNATEVTLEGIGSVNPSGSRSVNPSSSTTYVAVAKGPGGTQEASARVTVNPPPTATGEAGPSEEDLFARSVKDLFFDYDRYNIRPVDASNADADAKFFLDHPDAKVLIEGHCDDRGSEEYNLALGDSRASSMKAALLKAGVSADRIKTISYGKEKPFCSSDDEQCWQQNRRDHLVFQR